MIYPNAIIVFPEDVGADTITFTFFLNAQNIFFCQSRILNGIIESAIGAIGIEPGDEIIVSPVGFPTTIAPIVQNNMVPVFVDIEWDTLNFDLLKIEEKITERTKAIFVSPVLGNPPDMDFLKSLCEKHNLQLIGDSCDTLGTKWDGKPISDYYVAWSSSFYPAHHISTGEGGMVFTKDKDLDKKIRKLKSNEVLIKVKKFNIIYN